MQDAGAPTYHGSLGTTPAKVQRPRPLHDLTDSGILAKGQGTQELCHTLSNPFPPQNWSDTVPVLFAVLGTCGYDEFKGT